MQFIGHAIIPNFTFHDKFARCSYVHGLLHDVLEIVQITCPASHFLEKMNLHLYQNKRKLSIDFIFNIWIRRWSVKY